jgi:hypothetical protein
LGEAKEAFTHRWVSDPVDNRRGNCIGLRSRRRRYSLNPDRGIPKLKEQIRSIIQGRRRNGEAEPTEAKSQVHFPPPLVKFELELLPEAFRSIVSVIRPHLFEPLAVGLPTHMVPNASVELILSWPCSLK